MMRAAWFFAAFFVLFFECGNGLAFENQKWDNFKLNFISPDGRVIDFSQQRCSHSEGQGYGMLLAVSYDDKETFTRIWEWTKNNLGASRTDNLFAWKWGERLPGTWAVIDTNNATDGDTLIAFGLLLGAKKWHDQTLKAHAVEIIRSIRQQLVLRDGGKIKILPGYFGFISEEGIVVNLSYLVVSAYTLFAEDDDRAFWQQVKKNGLDLIAESTFSDLALPPDWLFIGKNSREVYSLKSEHFSYDAIRVFLYLSWDGSLDKLPGASKYLDFIERCGMVPRSINLVDNSSSLREAPAGFYAVLARVARDLDRNGLGARLQAAAETKIPKESKDYYSQILYLLAEIMPLQ